MQRHIRCFMSASLKQFLEKVRPSVSSMIWRQMATHASRAWNASKNKLTAQAQWQSSDPAFKIHVVTCWSNFLFSIKIADFGNILAEFIPGVLETFEMVEDNEFIFTEAKPQVHNGITSHDVTKKNSKTSLQLSESGSSGSSALVPAVTSTYNANAEKTVSFDVPLAVTYCEAAQKALATSNAVCKT